MSSDWQYDVEQFRKRFGLPVLDRPVIRIPDADMRLHGKLMEEEFDELLYAMHANDLAGIADGAADLIYVILGAMAQYGIYMQPVWDLVQKANMAKTGGGTRSDGKILKPDGWTAPDIEGEIERQRDE